MGLVDKGAQAGLAAEERIDRAIVGDGVWTAQPSFAPSTPIGWTGVK